MGGVAGTRCCLGEWKEWSGIELRNWLGVLFFFVFARLKPHTHAHTQSAKREREGKKIQEDLE